MGKFSDQFTDQDLNDILLLADYFQVKWSDALHVVMARKGIDSLGSDMMDGWELTTRLQNLRKKNQSGTL